MPLEIGDKLTKLLLTKVAVLLGLMAILASLASMASMAYLAVRAIYEWDRIGLEVREMERER